mgnify:CR=1 FL=1
MPMRLIRTAMLAAADTAHSNVEAGPVPWCARDGVESTCANSRKIRS